MKPNRVLTAATVLLLLAPAFLVSPPAEAQTLVGDAPPTKHPVFYKDVETNPVLYLRDLTDQVNPQAVSRPGLTTAEPPSHRDPPPAAGNAPKNATDLRPRTKTKLIVPASVGEPPNNPTEESAYRAQFTFDHPSAVNVHGLRHDVTLRGANAVQLVLFVQAPPGLRYTAELLTNPRTVPGTQVIASGTFEDTVNQGAGRTALDRFSVTITLALSGGATEVTLLKGSRLHLEVFATQTSLSSGSNQALDGGTWSVVYDAKEYPSRLILSAKNALKIASWTQTREERPAVEPQVEVVFRNFSGQGNFETLRGQNRFLHSVDGRFAVASAFGLTDLVGIRPIADIVDPVAEKAIRIHPWNPYVASCADDLPIDQIPMNQVSAAESSGVRVFRFQRASDTNAPSCLYHDYWFHNRSVAGQKAAGEFGLRVKARYQPSPLAGTDLVSSWRFQVSSVNVKLRAFTDGAVTETTSHQVARGGSTTFLLDLTNDAAANDTIKVTPRPTNPSTGFTIEPIVPVLGDAQVVGANLFRLPPHSSAVLAVTLRAPNADESASFQVTAESQTDPSSSTSSQSMLLSAVTFVDSQITRPTLTQALHQPRVVAREKHDVQPGAPRLYSVFVWNRYVVPQNLDVQMKRDKMEGWDVDLVHNGRPVKTATVNAVPAGGLVGLHVEVEVARGTKDKTERVTINATLPSGGFDIHQKVITFTAKVLETYEIRILEGITDRLHTAETFDATAFARDHVNGVWYRVWITNNDAADHDFKISGTIREDPLPAQAEAGTVVWGPIKVYHRDAGGAISTERDVVTVEPGQTAERYVWVRHDPNHDRRQATGARGADVTITVQRDPDTPNPEPARSKTVRVNVGIARFGSEARSMGASIEPVARLPTYSLDKPYIDISRLDSQKTAGTVPLGGLAHYRFRVTNGASWWYFKDPVQTSSQPSGDERPGQNLWWDNRLNITLTGVDKADGWTAYYRLAAAASTGETGARLPAPVPADCARDELRNPALWVNATDTSRNFLVYPPLNLDSDGTFQGTGSAGAQEPVALVNPQLGREGFWDGELEVVVCPPPAGHPVRPLAGQFDELQIQVLQVGPRAAQSRAIWEVKTIIEAAPRIVLEPRVKDNVATATLLPSRQEAVIPIFVANNGSYLTNLSLEARLKGVTAWSVSGESLINITPLRAFENRTVSFRVLPPTAGTGAVVEDATLEIVATYPRNLYDPRSPVQTITREVRLTTTQVPQKLTLAFGTPPSGSACTGSATALTCTANLPEDTQARFEGINIPLTVRNDDPNAMQVTISVPTMDGWFFAETNNFRYQSQVLTVPAGTTIPHSFLITPPRDVVRGSVADVVITVRDSTGQHISTRIAKVVIQGGLSVVSLDVARGKEFVERNDTTRFPIAIRNVGNVDGHFRLAAFLVKVDRAESNSVDPRLCKVELKEPHCWQAWVEDLGGARLDNNPAKAATIYLARNELRYVNLTVKAPSFFEQENAKAHARLIAWNSTLFAENKESGRIDVLAEIQDYGVELTPSTDTMTLVPGRAGTMLVGIKNTGDANDTLNLSLDLGGLTNWRYQFSTTNVFLPSGSGTGVLLTIQTPIDPLPAPRTAKFWIFLGTRGGQATNVSVFGFEPLFVTIPDYRQLDVDGDNITELAVDTDRDRSNGYEDFVEYSTIVRVTKMLDKALGKDRKTKFLLDIPTASGTYDNVADRFWDPDSNLVTAVKGRLDLDKDQTTDYLLDTDGDDVVDTAYQAATRQFLKAERVKLLGAEAGFQYLLDSNGDGKPDRYFDPVKNVVTKLVPQRDQSPTTYGVDTDDDGRVDLFYDDRTKVVTPAGGVKIAEFLQEFWYVPVGFVAILVLFGVVLMRRRMGGA